jgi:hypothetical protein
MSDFRVSDAPVPFKPDAQFAAWKQSVEERLRQLEHKRSYIVEGPVVYTTDASGYIVFFHGAFETPKAVFVQPETNAWDHSVVDLINEQTARVRAINHVGTVIANTSLTFRFVVFL